jgi:hypothetical protein
MSRLRSPHHRTKNDLVPLEVAGERALKEKKLTQRTDRARADARRSFEHARAEFGDDFIEWVKEMAHLCSRAITVALSKALGGVEPEDRPSIRKRSR